MSRTMYDSVTAERIPSDAKLVGCYIDGHYANEAAVRARCPHATIVRITPHGTAGAHVADCELGDLTPEQATVWAANEIAAGRQPTIYMNASTWPTVRQHVAAHGLTGKVSYWVAHYDNVPVIPVGAVAKQYIERTDQNLDYSIAADYWPGVDPAPAQPAVKPAVSTPAPSPQPVQEDDMPVIANNGHTDGHWLTDLLTVKRPIHDKAEELALKAAGLRSVVVPQATLDAVPTR